MKDTIHILIKMEDGLYVITDMPEKPSMKMSELDANAHPEFAYQFEYEWEFYNKALKSAKDSSIKVKNEQMIMKIILRINNLFSLEVDAIYPLQGYKFEIVDFYYCKLCGTYESYRKVLCDKEYCGKMIKKLVIVSPIEVKPVEESQEDIWRKIAYGIGGAYIDWSSQTINTSQILRDFHITRKQ